VIVSSLGKLKDISTTLSNLSNFAHFRICLNAKSEPARTLSGCRGRPKEVTARHLIQFELIERPVYLELKRRCVQL
jgi:hypothetical protein